MTALRPARVQVFLGCWLLLVVAVRFAEPVQDSDLFWHMAYARQMLQHATLIPDHGAFSWTPTSNRMIYCAWLAEFVLYGLWQAFGLAGIFALRYAVLLAVLALAWRYARRRGVAESPVSALLLLLLPLASYVGTLTKPELFSLLFFNVVVYAYFRAREEDRAGGRAGPWLFLVPGVVALWVNMHGGFVLLAPLLLVVAAGEALNRRFSPLCALGPRAFRQMLAAWALCAVSVCMTPYGIAYPRQLVSDNLLRATPRPDIAWNNAHQTIWSPRMPRSTFATLLLVMLLLAVVLAVAAARRAGRGGRLDFALLLANLVYAALFAAGPLRVGYFWPAVFTYSSLHWLHLARAGGPWPALPRARLGVATICLALVLGLGGASIYRARYRPYDGSWLGFGTGYMNPVVEADFLEGHALGPRLYTIFDSGGYLLWRLAPRYQVMVDGRSFPYLGWFDDQYRFARGEAFAEFLEKYPAKTAVIDLAKRECVRNFLRAPDWRVVFYGPTAAVFVQKSVSLPETASRFAPERFASLRNGVTALRVFEFAAAVGDDATVWRVLRQLETRLRWQVDAVDLRAAVAYREAHQALHAANYAAARDLFNQALRDKTIGDRDGLILLFLDRMDAAVAQNKASDVEIYRPALEKLAARMEP